jgi:aspartyl-tRNA(Asn)/glutamyl-tRNA(Gln) amidotransferase subunit C
MSISEEQVRHVAMLARVAVTDDEVAKLAVELSSILDHVGTIAELDLSDVEPATHAVPVVNSTRPDEVRAGLSQHDALLNAPQQRDGAFVIPKIG